MKGYNNFNNHELIITPPKGTTYLVMICKILAQSICTQKSTRKTVILILHIHHIDILEGKSKTSFIQRGVIYAFSLH